MTIIGMRRQSHGELKTSVSFLANDWDLNQEQVPIASSSTSLRKYQQKKFISKKTQVVVEV